MRTSLIALTVKPVSKFVFIRFFIFFMFLMPSICFPSIPPRPQITQSGYKTEGVFTGGLGGYGFSILDVRRSSAAQKKLERIVIDVGDISGQAQLGLPGYYHAQLIKSPPRLVIDFSQTLENRIASGKLAQSFAKSLYVVKAVLSADRSDLSTNLTLELRPEVKAKVYPVEGKTSTSKVVIDLTK